MPLLLEHFGVLVAIADHQLRQIARAVGLLGPQVADGVRLQGFADVLAVSADLHLGAGGGEAGLLLGAVRFGQRDLLVEGRDFLAGQRRRVRAGIGGHQVVADLVLLDRGVRGLRLPAQLFDPVAKGAVGVARDIVLRLELGRDIGLAVGVRDLCGAHRILRRDPHVDDVGQAVPLHRNLADQGVGGLVDAAGRRADDPAGVGGVEEGERMGQGEQRRLVRLARRDELLVLVQAQLLDDVHRQRPGLQDLDVGVDQVVVDGRVTARVEQVPLVGIHQDADGRGVVGRGLDRHQHDDGEHQARNHREQGRTAQNHGQPPARIDLTHAALGSVACVAAGHWRHGTKCTDLLHRKLHRRPSRAQFNIVPPERLTTG